MISNRFESSRYEGKVKGARQSPSLLYFRTEQNKTSGLDMLVCEIIVSRISNKRLVDLYLYLSLFGCAVQASIAANTWVISGTPVTKSEFGWIPDIE